VSETIYDIGEKIRRAIENFVNWISTNVGRFADWLWQSIVGVFIQPVQQGLQMWVTRFVQRLPQVLYVAVVMPVEVRLFRSFIREPSIGKLLKMALAPIAGYAAAQLMDTVLKAVLGAPPAAAAPMPATPVSPPAVTGWAEVAVPRVEDKLDISDEVELLLRPLASVYTVDSVELSDDVSVAIAAAATAEVTVGEQPPGAIAVEDTVDIADSGQLSVYTPAEVKQSFSDSVNISDEATVTTTAS